MERVAVRELNQDTAGVLARVQRGETLEITSSGRPVARLVPIQQNSLASLIEAGRVRPSTRTFDLTVRPEDVAAEAAGPSDGLVAIIRQDRDARP